MTIINAALENDKLVKICFVACMLRHAILCVLIYYQRSDSLEISEYF